MEGHIKIFFFSRESEGRIVSRTDRNGRTGYGFIECDDGPDIFVHVSQLREVIAQVGGEHNLPGISVVFNVVEGDRGRLQAWGVELSPQEQARQAHRAAEERAAEEARQQAERLRWEEERRRRVAACVNLWCKRNPEEGFGGYKDVVSAVESGVGLRAIVARQAVVECSSLAFVLSSPETLVEGLKLSPGDLRVLAGEWLQHSQPRRAQLAALAIGQYLEERDEQVIKDLVEFILQARPAPTHKGGPGRVYSEVAADAFSALATIARRLGDPAILRPVLECLPDWADKYVGQFDYGTSIVLEVAKAIFDFELTGGGPDLLPVWARDALHESILRAEDLSLSTEDDNSEEIRELFALFGELPEVGTCYFCGTRFVVPQGSNDSYEEVYCPDCYGTIRASMVRVDLLPGGKNDPWWGTEELSTVPWGDAEGIISIPEGWLAAEKKKEKGK